MILFWIVLGAFVLTILLGHLLSHVAPLPPLPAGAHPPGVIPSVPEQTVCALCEYYERLYREDRWFSVQHAQAQFNHQLYGNCKRRKY